MIDSHPPSPQHSESQWVSDSVPSKSDSLSPTGAHRIARPQPSLVCRQALSSTRPQSGSISNSGGRRGTVGVSRSSVGALGWCLGGCTSGIRSSDPWQLPITQLSEVQSISSGSSSTWSTLEESLSQTIWREERNSYTKRCEQKTSKCFNHSSTCVCSILLFDVCPSARKENKRCVFKSLIAEELAGDYVGDWVGRQAPRQWDWRCVMGVGEEAGWWWICADSSTHGGVAGSLLTERAAY